jgi:hypothetical protein
MIILMFQDSVRYFTIATYHGIRWQHDKIIKLSEKQQDILHGAHNCV